MLWFVANENSSDGLKIIAEGNYYGVNVTTVIFDLIIGNMTIGNIKRFLVQPLWCGNCFLFHRLSSRNDFRIYHEIILTSSLVCVWYENTNSYKSLPAALSLLLMPWSSSIKGDLLLPWQIIAQKAITHTKFLTIKIIVYTFYRTIFL